VIFSVRDFKRSGFWFFENLRKCHFEVIFGNNENLEK
jgi:hypothetical protein